MAKGNGETSSEKGKRGPRGPRQTIFACFARRGDKDVAEDILAKTPEEAGKIFKEKNKLKASSILGPHYEVKGTGQGSTARKVFLRVDLEKQALTYSTEKRFKAQLEGWNVMATCVKAIETDQGKFGDDELAHVLFTSLVDSKDKRPKPRLDVALVRFTDLQNTQQI